MDELTLKKRLHVVDLYFCGLSFDQIAVKAGISKGSVSNIIAELKGGIFPETSNLSDQLEALRELSVDLAKLKKTPVQALVGLAVLNRIYELDLDPADMERWPLLLHAIKTPDDASELIAAAYSVRDIQKSSGLSLPALEEKVKQLGEQASALEETNAKISTAKAHLQELVSKANKYSESIQSLEEKFNWLTPRVEELHLREKNLLETTKQILIDSEKAKETLAILNTETKKLEKTGLSVEALVDFANKIDVVARHHGIKQPAVRNRLLQELKYLDKGLTLESLVNTNKQLFKDINLTIAKRKKEKVTLEAVVSELIQQRQNIETTIQTITTSVICEINQLVPVIRDTSRGMSEELKNGCAEALSEVRQLKDASVAVGQEVGQFEGILAQSSWIKKLNVLMGGGSDLNQSDVRALSVLVNRGLVTWVKLNQNTVSNGTWLLLKIEDYLKELEQWKITK